MQISILKHSDFGVNLSGFFNWRKFTWEQFICLPMFSFQSNYSTPLASICFKWYMVLIAFFCWKRDFAYQFEFFFIGSGPEGVEKNLLTFQNHSRVNLFRGQFHRSHFIGRFYFTTQLRIHHHYPSLCKCSGFILDECVSSRLIHITLSISSHQCYLTCWDNFYCVQCASSSICVCKHESIY